MQTIVLIRGLPGSGKSTLAKAMVGYRHFEADQFFIDAEGVYQYDSAKIRDAHQWCQNGVIAALKDGDDVVVSNTFTRHFEMRPYFEIAKNHNADVVVLTAKGNWQNVHGVPAEVIAKMRDRWED